MPSVCTLNSPNSGVSDPFVLPSLCMLIAAFVVVTLTFKALDVSDIVTVSLNVESIVNRDQQIWLRIQHQSLH